MCLSPAAAIVSVHPGAAPTCRALCCEALHLLQPHPHLRYWMRAPLAHVPPPPLGLSLPFLPPLAPS
jgi:hypothetical protein